MAIAHSNTTTVTATSATITFTSYVVSGTDPVLVVAVATRGSGTTVTGVTWNAAAEVFTEEITDINNDARTTLFYLESPTATTANIVVTASGSNRMVAAASLYTGVDGATPIRAGVSNSANGNSASPSVSLTGVSGDMLYNSLGQVSAGPDSATANHTQRSNGAETGGGTDTRGATQEFAATGGSDTFSWTMGGSDSWAMCAMALREPFTPSNFPFLHYARMRR
jgi:hypothetical protein